MKKYELKYEEGETGVFRMSTVESPAIGATLIMFDDESKLLEFADEEKKVVYSVAMRPNILIPRKNINGEPAMVFYTEDTVSKLQQNFFKNNSHNGITVNHDNNIRNDVYAFESWIVRNDEQAKSIPELGAKIGDWVLGQKVDNPEVWQKIKNKELQGFSIEAYLEPVLTTNSIEMTEEEIDARIKKVLMETQSVVTEPETEEEEEEVIVEQEEEAAPAVDYQKIIDDQSVEIHDLKAKLAELEDAKTMMSKELVEMGEELKKGLKPVAMGAKKYEEMTALEKFRASKNK